METDENMKETFVESSVNLETVKVALETEELVHLEEESSGHDDPRDVASAEKMSVGRPECSIKVNDDVKEKSTAILS